MQNHHRQFSGLIGFLFTNAFIAYKYFGGKSGYVMTHTEFKMKLANQMVNFRDFDSIVLRSVATPQVGEPAEATDHVVRYFNTCTYRVTLQQRCWYCRNGYDQRVVPDTKTSYYCWEAHQQPRGNAGTSVGGRKKDQFFEEKKRPKTDQKIAKKKTLADHFFRIF